MIIKSLQNMVKGKLKKKKKPLHGSSAVITKNRIKAAFPWDFCYISPL